jgi:4-hydroxybenzoate polyprenyltransferase
LVPTALDTNARMRNKVETCFWMARPAVIVDSVFYVACGWFTSQPGFRLNLLVVVLAAWLARGGGLILNDVFDYPKDKVTAPAMPLPAGKIGVRTATWTGITLAGVAIVLSTVAAVNDTGRLGIPVASTVFLALNYLYSRHKAKGVWASLAISIQVSFAAVFGWLVGGAAHPVQFAVIFATLTIFGVRQNIIAGLRDIDSDPKVGNRTTAVRLGLGGSVVAVLVLAGVCALLLAGVSLVRDNLPGVAFALAAGTVAVASIPGMRARFLADQQRTRASRSVDLRKLAGRCYAVAVAFPFIVSPWAAVAVLVFHRLALTVLAPLQRRRVVDGAW